MADDGRIPIRSFRVVFELERRLHKIDRWRIPVPYGVPLRGIAYALLALGAVMFVERLPLAGDLLRLLPPPLRLVILPVGVAYLLWRLRIDGRPGHAALSSAVRFQLAPRRVSAFRPVPALAEVATLGELALCPDEHSPRYRKGRLQGPASIVLRFPARARARGRTLELRQASDEPMLWGKRAELRHDQRLLVR